MGGGFLGGPDPRPPSTNFQYMPGVQQATGAITAGMNNAMGQQAPQLDTAAQAQFRNSQLQQQQQLTGIASGQQQGAGELATQRQVANALAAQQAQARMARGGANAGLAYRGAANNAAAVGVSGAGQSQQAALSDQMNAQNMLSNVNNQGRQGDLSMAGQNAQLQQTQMQQNNAANLGYLSQLTGLSIAQLQAMSAEYAAKMQQPSATGQLLQAGGQIGAAFAGAPPGR